MFQWGCFFFVSDVWLFICCVCACIKCGVVVYVCLQCVWETNIIVWAAESVRFDIGLTNVGGAYFLPVIVLYLFRHSFANIFQIYSTHNIHTHTHIEQSNCIHPCVCNIWSSYKIAIVLRNIAETFWRVCRFVLAHCRASLYQITLLLNILFSLSSTLREQGLMCMLLVGCVFSVFKGFVCVCERVCDKEQCVFFRLFVIRGTHTHTHTRGKGLFQWFFAVNKLNLKRKQITEKNIYIECVERKTKRNKIKSKTN